MTIDFFKDNNYKKEHNFKRVKFGINKPLLEVELNEMQRIQEASRSSMINNVVSSGVLERLSLDFNGLPIVLNPNQEPNKIAIAPFKVIVAGNEIQVEGKESINLSHPRYQMVNLGDAPSSYDVNNPTNFDFVFLEVWFEELTIFSDIYKHGNIDGATLPNIIEQFDNKENSRRVGLRYRFRVQKNIWFQAYDDIFIKNTLYAQGKLSSEPSEEEKRFEFKPYRLDGDFGLYVAQGENINEQLSVLNGEIYAIPLFVVKRRVFKDYASTSIDFSIHAPNKQLNKISYRPDGLYSDFFIKEDILDVRRMVSFAETNYNQSFDDTFRKLITNQLYTSQPLSMIKKTINEYGLISSFDNRNHIDEVSQLLLVNPNSNSFVLTESNNNQNYLYDIFGFNIDTDGNKGNTIVFTYKVPSGFSITTNNTKVKQKKESESKFIDATINSIDTANKKITIGGLIDNTSYQFKLEVLKDGVYDYSKTIYVKTKDITPPSKPTNLVFSNITATGFTLSWASSTDNDAIQGYEISIIKDNSNVERAFIAENTIQITGLTQYTSYDVIIFAYDKTLNYSTSDKATVRTKDVTPPNAPTGLQVTNKTDTTVTLSWSPSIDNESGLKEYRIYIDENSFYYETSLNTTYTIANLTQASEYDFHVSAIDNDGNESTWSSILVTTNPSPDSVAPTKPTNVQVVPNSVTKNSFTLTWTPSTDNVGIARYGVYINNILHGNTTSNQYVVSGLTEYTQYLVRVRAFDFAGNFADSHTGSETFYVRTADETSPTKPSNFSVSNISDTTCTLQWSPSTDTMSGVKEYVVYKIDSQTNEIIEIGKVTHGSTQRTFNVTGLVSDKNYGFTVRAVDNAENQSTQADIIYIRTTDTVAPTNPSNLQATKTPTTITLTWNSSTDSASGLKEYRLFRNGTEVGTVFPSVLGESTLSYTFVGLVANTTYAVSVQAVDNKDNRSGMVSLSVTTLQKIVTKIDLDVQVVGEESSSSISPYLVKSNNNGTIGNLVIAKLSTLNNQAIPNVGTVRFFVSEFYSQTSPNFSQQLGPSGTTDLLGEYSHFWFPDYEYSSKWKWLQVRFEGSPEYSESSIVIPIAVVSKKTSTYNPSGIDDTTVDYNSYSGSSSSSQPQQIGTTFTMPNVVNVYEMKVEQVFLQVSGVYRSDGTINKSGLLQVGLWNVSSVNGPWNLVAKSNLTTVYQPSGFDSFPINSSVGYDITYVDNQNKKTTNQWTTFSITNSMYVIPNGKYLVGFWRATGGNVALAYQVDKSATTTNGYQHKTYYNVSAQSEISQFDNDGELGNNFGLCFQITYSYWS